MFHQFLVAEESLNSVLFPSLKWRPIPKNSQNSGSSRVCVCVCVSPSLFSHVFGWLQIGQKRNRMETEIESNQQIFFNQNTSRANSAILETPFLLFPPFFFLYKIILFISICCWILLALCSVIESDGLVQMETSYTEEQQAELLAYGDSEQKAQTSSQPSRPNEHN